MPLFIRTTWLARPYRAMAVYPFILLREWEYRHDAVMVHHELIHHRQQLELLILPFYMIYIGHYLINLLRYRDHDRAYRQIIFEREAYAMETDRDYLHTRKFAAFLKH